MPLNGETLILCVVVTLVNAAKILVVIPTASFSHQVGIRPLSQELAKRGHEVVVITTDPVFLKGQTIDNFTEINTHDAVYDAKKKAFGDIVKGRKDDIIEQIVSLFSLFHVMFEAGIRTEEVQALLKDRTQHFDLVVLEACVRPALIFAHIYKAPAILFSSTGSFDMINDYTGAITHPFLYPTVFHQQLNNLSIREKLQERHKNYLIENAIASLEKEGDELLTKYFGDVPPIRKLKKNIAMMFLSEYHIWDNNRPVPPNHIYLGEMYPADIKELPKDLKSYLDSSEHGVIYISFGTTVKSVFIPQRAIDILINVFSKLKYDILFKWDMHELPGATNNVKLFKWLPQADLLHHPKIKLFISQGGLQSSNDAIKAGVPLIGMPMLGDQWYNVEQYIQLKIGLRLDIESVTEETMINTIKTVIEDESYRYNIISLRDTLHDQPQSPLERAVWWTEHVIRHNGSHHLRAPTALISSWDYYELDLVIVMATALLVLIVVLVLVLWTGLKYLSTLFNGSKDKIE